jgi:pilus assembly protein CpaF
VPARLEALASVAGLARDALHSQLASGLRVVVHLVRTAGRRRVAEVCVLRRGSDGLVVAAPAWSWDGSASQGMSGPAASALTALLA